MTRQGREAEDYRQNLGVDVIAPEVGRAMTALEALFWIFSLAVLLTSIIMEVSNRFYKDQMFLVRPRTMVIVAIALGVCALTVMLVGYDAPGP